MSRKGIVLVIHVVDMISCQELSQMLRKPEEQAVWMCPLKLVDISFITVLVQKDFASPVVSAFVTARQFKHFLKFQFQT